MLPTVSCRTPRLRAPYSSGDSSLRPRPLTRTTAATARSSTVRVSRRPHGRARRQRSPVPASRAASPATGRPAARGRSGAGLAGAAGTGRPRRRNCQAKIQLLRCLDRPDRELAHGQRFYERRNRGRAVIPSPRERSGFRRAPGAGRPAAREGGEYGRLPPGCPGQPSGGHQQLRLQVRSRRLARVSAPRCRSHLQ